MQSWRDQNRTIAVEATVDTGFSYTLKLPPETVEALGLPRIGDPRLAMLANNELHEFSAHAATVFLNGQRRSILVLAGPGEPLIGMALMWGSRLSMELREGGTVLIEEMTDANRL